MNLDKMQEIAAYLESATEEDKQIIADAIAKKAPYLFVGNIDVSDKEKATMLIKMQINMLSNEVFHVESITNFEHNLGFVQGLISGCSMSALITEQEKDAFKKEILDKRNNFYKTD